MDNIDTTSNNNLDLLKYAIERGMINMSYMQECIEMNKRKELLSKHPYSIWESKDGKWHTYLPDEKKGRVPRRRNTQKEIEDLVVKYWAVKEENPTFKEIFLQWIQEKYQYGEIQKNTYNRYYNDYLRFYADSDFEKEHMKSLEENDFYKFIKETIINKQLTAKAYSGLRTITKGVLKYAKRKGYTHISATEFFNDLDIGKNSFRKKIKDKTKEVFTDEEVRMITHYISENPTIRNLAILLAFQTGVRVGELASLKRGDINFKSKTLHIQRTEVTYKDLETRKSVNEVREYPKNENADRYIIIPDNGISTLKRILNINGFGEYLFEENGKRIRENAFNRRLTRICKNLGIPHRSMHKIRKTYGTLLIDNYTDESLIVEQMGHSDISVTKQYYYYCNRDTAEKHKQISNAIPY